MSERPEDGEDWPLREWSQRLRPPGGAEPAPTTEPEILYEDIPEPEEEEEAPEGEDVPEYGPEAEVVEEEVADEAAPALEEEPEAEPEPEPDAEAEVEPDYAVPDEHAEGEFRIPDGFAVLEGAPTGHRR